MTTSGMTRQNRNRAKWIGFAVVVGHDVNGLFDMMRYDHAEFLWAKEQSFGEDITKMLDGENVAWLISKQTDSKHGANWTIERWRSYGFELWPCSEMLASEIEHGHKKLSAAKLAATD